jgi:CRISPR/Cas system CMR-associated protein Cmr1 (group 7 of RAMP superfamily)
MTRNPWYNLTITAVTPMFLGKFTSENPKEQKGQIPFPVPSLRGVLAYWLRALAGAHVGDDLQRLARVEEAVFGGARTGDSGGPSTIWLRGRRPIGVKQFTPRSESNRYRIAYLMGPGLYGVMPAARCVEAGGEIQLDVRNTGSAVHGDLFLSALWALSTFGGIGARARRGFGTISVHGHLLRLPSERFDMQWLKHNSADDLADVLSCVGESIRELGIPVGTNGNSQPGYPRFDLSEDWHLLAPDTAIPEAGNAESALAWTSERLREFRLDGDENTAGWRDIVRPYLNGQSFSKEFRAGALGLPVVYTEKATQPGTNGRSASVEPVVGGQPSRRASPLWLRVHGRGASWWLRSLAFNAVWLPDDGTSLRIKVNSGVTRAPRQVTPPSPDTIRHELENWFSYIAAEGLD